MNAFWNALQFGTPLALWGLLALPMIWWLLRFTPPRPKQIKFPPIRILLGLPTQEETPDKTPWWLLLLRLGLAAVLIFAVAQPFLQPKGADCIAARPPSGDRRQWLGLGTDLELPSEIFCCKCLSRRVMMACQ